MAKGLPGVTAAYFVQVALKGGGRLHEVVEGPDRDIFLTARGVAWAWKGKASHVAISRDGHNWCAYEIIEDGQVLAVPQSELPKPPIVTKGDWTGCLVGGGRI